MIGIWIIILIVIGYTPIIYRINKRLKHIERQLETIKKNTYGND